MPADPILILFYRQYIADLQKAAGAPNPTPQQAAAMTVQIKEFTLYCERLTNQAQPRTLLAQFSRFIGASMVSQMIACPVPAHKLTPATAAVYLLAMYAEQARNYQPEKFLSVAIDYIKQIYSGVTKELEKELEKAPEKNQRKEDIRDRLLNEFVDMLANMVNALPVTLKNDVLKVANSVEYEDLRDKASETPNVEGLDDGYKLFHSIFKGFFMGIDEIVYRAGNNDMPKQKRTRLTSENSDDYLKKNQQSVVDICTLLTQEANQEKASTLHPG